MSKPIDFSLLLKHPRLFELKVRKEILRLVIVSPARALNHLIDRLQVVFALFDFFDELFALSFGAKDFEPRVRHPAKMSVLFSGEALVFDQEVLVSAISFGLPHQGEGFLDLAQVSPQIVFSADPQEANVAMSDGLVELDGINFVFEFVESIDFRMDFQDFLELLFFFIELHELDKGGPRRQARTADFEIKSFALYQLSYAEVS